jgi:hypothetical protein
MHKSSLLLLLLLALVGVGFLALRVGSGGSPDRPSGRQVPERSQPGGTDPSPAQGAGVALEQVAARLEGGAQNGQRVAENTRTRVRVTHPDGAPFPGVLLVFLDRTRVRGWEKQWDDGRARRTFIRSKGASYESDEAGEVLIPRTLSGVLCTRNPGLHGEWEWQSSAPLEHTLVVSSVSDLHLRVEDSAGRPRSEVAVVLERELKGDHIPVVSGVSTAPGGAVIFSALRRSLGDPSPGSRFTATFGFPCENPPRVAFDAFALPEEPLVLTLPPIGSIRVRVYNERGVLMDEVVDVSLGRLDVGGVFGGASSQRLVGGEAVFGHVGVGTRLAVRLGGSRKRPAHIEEISGPASDGDEKIVTIKWEQLHPFVVGRAVREGGQVLAGQRGRYTLDQGQGLIGGPPLTTDGQGRFRIVLSGPAERGIGGAVGGSPDRQEVFELEAALFSVAGQAPYEAVRTFRVPDSAAEYDLGDLVFHKRPLLASGRVTDIVGAALLGVHVRAEEQSPKDKRWSPVRDQSAVTDHEGKYTIYGTPSGLPLRLVAMRRGFRTTTLASFPNGSSAVDIVLPLAGSPGSGDGKRDRPTRGKPGLVPGRDGGN